MPDENTPAGETPPPSWFIDEGIPGAGDRPAWLGEKFKTVKDLANSYSELEKKFGTPPDEYDFSKSKRIDPEFEGFKDLKQMAKEKRIPQDFMDKMQETYDKYAEVNTVDYEAETAKLGENAKDRLSTLDNWAKANLSAEAADALLRNINTADAFKALEEIRGKMMGDATLIPNGNDGGSASGAASVADLQKELANPANLLKYKSDPNYVKDYQARLAAAAKSSGYIDKLGG